MLFLSTKVDAWFGDGLTQKPQVVLITIVFFFLWFLTATQDISVDGWAITMLQRRNIGYAATVNCFGQSFGALMGFILFLMLESKDFCNKYIFSEPREEGLLKLSSFLVFWGIAFLSVTLIVVVFKREKNENLQELENHLDFGFKKAYPVLWKIVNLKPILKTAAILMTFDMAVAAVDVISTLKLIEYGISKDVIAIFNIPSFVAQLALPILISRYTAGPKPLGIFTKVFPVRLTFSAVIAVFIYFTPRMLEGRFNDVPMSYYAVFLTILLCYQVRICGGALGIFEWNFHGLIHNKMSLDPRVCVASLSSSHENNNRSKHKKGIRMLLEPISAIKSSAILSFSAFHQPHFCMRKIISHIFV
jgi:MFS transporter, PAT family, solute carrier family 33 (acetyl-CoA transportor), member 1